MSEVTDKWLDDQIAALEQTGVCTGEWIVYPVVLHRALCELRERRKQDAKPAMNGIGAARVVAEPTMDGTVSAQYSAAALAHDAEVFGDVSIVELARTMEALEQRLEVIERWRTALIDQENDGCSEYKEYKLPRISTASLPRPPSKRHGMKGKTREWRNGKAGQALVRADDQRQQESRQIPRVGQQPRGGSLDAAQVRDEPGRDEQRPLHGQGLQGAGSFGERA